MKSSEFDDIYEQGLIALIELLRLGRYERLGEMLQADLVAWQTRHEVSLNLGGGTGTVNDVGFMWTQNDILKPRVWVNACFYSVLTATRNASAHIQPAGVEAELSLRVELLPRPPVTFRTVECEICFAQFMLMDEIEGLAATVWADRVARTMLAARKAGELVARAVSGQEDQECLGVLDELAQAARKVELPLMDHDFNPRERDCLVCHSRTWGGRPWQLKEESLEMTEVRRSSSI